MLFVIWQLISCVDQIPLYKKPSALIQFHFEKQKVIKTIEDGCLNMCNNYKSKLDIPSSYSGCSDICADDAVTSCLHKSCSGDSFDTEADALACVNSCLKDEDKGLSKGAIIGIVVAVIVVVAVVIVVVVIVIRKKKASSKSFDEGNTQENV